MIKTKTGKILIALIISVVMFNFISTNYVFADPPTDSTSTPGTASEEEGTGYTSDLDAWQKAQEILKNQGVGGVTSKESTDAMQNAGKQSAGTTNSDTDHETGQAAIPNSTSSSSSAAKENAAKDVMSDKELTLSNTINGAVESVKNDGISGIFSVLIRYILVGAGGAIQFLSSVLGTSAGTTDKDSFTFITPDYILFNKLAITDINFFKLNSFGAENKSFSGNSNPIKILKENVATWYTTLRALSMAILLVILIYIGIRMVIASTGEDKSKYKKMLTSWLTSFAILFLLHYIILLFINVNNALVDMIAGVANKSGVDSFGDYVSKLAKSAILATTAVSSISISWLYLVIAIVTLVFLFMYVKRMLTIAFLILISPIITITYSIDKVGDGKAQAFNAWIKEFGQNVLIQPFHCIIYVAFVSSSIKMVSQSPTMGGALFVVLTMIFIFMAEKIVKGIFGITAQSVGSGMGTTMAIWGAAKYLGGGSGSKPKTPPSNVGKGKQDKGNTPKGTPKSDSMVATNNLNQSNQPQDKDSGKPQTTSTPKNTVKSESEQLADRMLNPYAQAADYDETMSDKTQAEKMADAEASDYDELMGYSDTPSSNVADAEAAEPAIPRQRFYGGLGDKTPNYKEGMKRQKIYGGLGTLPPEQNQGGNNVPPTTEAPGSNAAPSATETKGKVDPNIKMPEVTNNNPSLWKLGKSAGGTAAKGVGKVLWEANKLGAKAGGAIIGATFAGLTGADASQVIGAGVLGKNAITAVGNKGVQAKDKMLETINGVKIRNDEKTLATAFSNYKAGKEYDRGTDINQARNYLNMDSNKIKDIKNTSERQYVQALHAMRNAYNKDEYSEEDPNERVIETMEKIVNEEIEPKYY